MKIAILFSALWLVASARADTLDTIGVTALRNADQSLTGSGVHVAQIEAADQPRAFEVSPSYVSQPETFFTYNSAQGRAM
ncbi:MAG: hypothetical protein QOD99_2140, partial [Chthoniobacter sp.]|nr:hypothetical protein [Chthoniobacter sp.]